MEITRIPQVRQLANRNDVVSDDSSHINFAFNVTTNDVQNVAVTDNELVMDIRGRLNIRISGKSLRLRIVNDSTDIAE